MIRRSLPRTLAALATASAIASTIASTIAISRPAAAAPMAAIDPTGGSRIASGVLSAPSRRAPAELARAYLAGDARLSAGVTTAALIAAPARRLADGALVELAQVHRGVPVVGSGASVRLDHRGRVRWVRSALRPLPAALSVTPALDAAAALAAAGGPRADRAALSHARARLIVWAPASATAPRLAWQLRLPLDRARLELWETVVDAATGAVLARRNLILRAAGHTARVHAQNPIATPTPTMVTFDSLASGATRLSGPDVVATTCVDDRSCSELFGGEQHFCTLRQTAATNGAGNFLDHAMPIEAQDPADTFAEVAVYFHTSQAYAFFRELVADPGFALAGAPIRAVANMRMFGLACVAGQVPDGSALEALDNAFYSPAGEAFFPGVSEASINLGQGEQVDYGYDGDVIYHELGHGFVATLAPELGFALRRPTGWDSTPSGLAEGLPDYLSSALTGEPRLGEYVGATFSPASGVIRDLDNTARCPDALAGESHADGEIVGGALWEIRAGLAANQRGLLDRAVATAIDALGADSNFASFQATLVAEIEVVLGGAAAERARAVLEARGLDDCDGFVRDLGAGQVHPLLFLLLPPLDELATLVPAPVQFRVVLDAASPTLRMTARLVEGSDPSGLHLLIKPGAAPITWTEDHDAPQDIALVSEDGLTIAQEIDGPFAAGVYHLQLATENSSQGLIDIAIEPPTPEPTVPDAGTGGDAADAGGDAAADDDGGCGCRATGGGRGLGGSALLALGAALLLGRRRRR
jgi:hypothetical protein